jgi:hypothetical protein
MQDEVTSLTGRYGSVDPLEVWVLPDLRGRLFDDRRRLSAADEQQQRGLGVPPDEVAQQLRQRVPDRLGALPDLASGDEDIAVPGPDQDVGLAGPVETSPAAPPSNCAFKNARSRKRIISSFRWAVIDAVRSSALRALRGTSSACPYCVSGSTARAGMGRAPPAAGPPRGVRPLPDGKAYPCLKIAVGQQLRPPLRHPRGDRVGRLRVPLGGLGFRC